MHQYIERSAQAVLASLDLESFELRRCSYNYFGNLAQVFSDIF